MLSTNFYKKIFIFSILLASFSNLSFAQSRVEIENLFDEVCKVEDSKNIIKSESAMKISSYNESALNILTDFFTDNSKTKVYSVCLKRKLNRGEVAIILCDRIEIMPYFKLLGIQNCIFSFCKDNPNFVELYLDIIKKQPVSKFKEKYIEWLHSEERLNTRI